MLCSVAGNFFVPVSFMSELVWGLTGHSDKLNTLCVSLFLLELEGFPVHSTISYKV